MSVPYRVARMLNQLRRGHKAWPMFELKSGAATAAPAAPMPPPLYEDHFHLMFVDIQELSLVWVLPGCS